MRISDLSSDVCSSDLSIADQGIDGVALAATVPMVDAIALIMSAEQACIHQFGNGATEITLAGCATACPHFLRDHAAPFLRLAGEQSVSRDRQSVVLGKSGVVRVYFGGRRIIKKKNKH